MPNKRSKLNAKTKVKLALIGLLVLALVVYLVLDVILGGPLMTLLSNRDQLVETVRSWGFFAPLIYIVLQMIQTVVAPIPAQIVGSVGGFIFGPWGILWTLIGSLIGCWIVFKLARRFGRPLLEKFFKKSAIKKFDFLVNSQGTSLALFAIFLLPGFPDDLVCYLAGLTKLPIRRLMLLVGLGHLPGIVVTNFIGSGITDHLEWVIAITVLVMILLGIMIWQRERIIQFLKKDKTEPKPTNKDHHSE